MNKPAVEMVATDKLIPYARNAKKHDEAQVALIAGSIRQFGFNNPILIAEDNGIVAGHGRVLAAMKLGMAEVPCIRLSHLDENQRRAYILADNRLAELGGGWDLDMLAAEMDALGELNIDVGELGFDESFLSLMELPETDNAVDAEPQIDKAEELREKWGVKLGDLWQLGEHRLICGDCTDKAVVERVMQGERAELLLTDPPYNLGFDYGKNVDDRKITQDYKEFLQAFFSVWSDVSDKQIITPGKQNLNLWLDTDFIDVGCWYKKNAMSGSKIAHLNLWEPILFFGKFDRKSRPSDLFEYNVKQQEGVGGHPCPKIIDLWKDIIVHYSSSGARIADCFDGAGTTIVACEQTGRVAVVSELEPKYVAVAIQRWVDVTGGEPVMLSN